ncbi:hypothetical protein CERZMDRAFT_113593 [Cercospora zeae-maydis SCOH1-5]|uniref:Uncharacterized protein n=1 Tax=Cercospora zeae-maydis SCOH1-5 TaxID=717836 RepID=A0A6A6F8W5_9PEZI|nr:hypothetical protein CERZMDRAFT_113593 [Cercospora zeae-maydis SCOH1-5]
MAFQGKVLAQKGASISLADTNATLLAKVESDFKAQGVPVLTTVLDVQSRQDVEQWIASTLKEFCRLDCAANIAGIVGKQLGHANLTEVDDDDWNLVMGVNVTGVLNCLRAEMKVISEGGSVVNVSSEKGVRGGAKAGAYCTSKHAVIGMSKCAALEGGPRKVRVNVVAPGGTWTPLMRSVVGDVHPPAQNALQRHGEADEVANLIVWLLGDQSSFITGAVHHVDGGLFC